MPWSAIPKTLRHREDGPPSTATPTRDAQQQSPWHGATHATRAAAIPMAQRHPRDTPSSNPHGTAPHTPHARHARRPSSQPATTFHGTAPHTRHARRSLPLRSKKRPLHPQIHGFPAPATISQRPTRARTRDLSHRATKSSDFSDRARLTAPATRIHRPVPSRAHQCIRSTTPAARNAGHSA